MSGLRRNMMAASRGAGVDWENIARGMLDLTTEFSVPLIDGLNFDNKASVFINRNNLKAITIPSTMTTIGNGCFQNCTGLTEIVIPEGITQLNSLAFGYCYGLVHVTLPSTLTTIGDRAFMSCQKLDNITIPSNVTSMGIQCLAYTYRMRYVIMEGSTPPTLGAHAFDNARILEAIYVPDASVEAYKAASGWSAIADRIKPLSELGGVNE